MIIALLISLFLLLGTSLMGQNPPIALPADGDWPTVVGDSIMLIGPKQEALTEEQRYFNPPYLLVYPGKEHLKNDMIRAAICDCNPANPNRRIGVFSVAPDKQVSFSQGNLQYLPAANIWKFADTQYEYLGNANKYLKPTFRNWVDLFGWSANNTTAPFGVSTSTNAADYAGDFVDWGTNTICGDAPGTWRTLSIEEWKYLFENRANAAQLYGVAQVVGENGMIILPDDWVAPDGITFKHGFHQNDLSFAQHQTFTEQQWLLMETAGAIFLPAAGIVYNSIITAPKAGGHYQSSDTDSINTNYWFGFRSSYYTIQSSERCTRRAVRLVHDTIVPTPKIIWYTDEAIKEGSNGASLTGMAGWAYLHPEGMETTELNRRYQGKRINCIRLQVAQAGTFTVSVANRDRLDSIFNIQTIMLNNPSKEPQVYHLPQTIHLQKNQVLVFANPTDQARFYYSSLVGDISFADYVGHPTQTVRITGGPKTLNIDAGYYCEDGENCDTLAIPEPEYVDLGLSVKWATFNVGATSPEDYGDYFAWGETEPKEEYTWENYKWCDGTDANMTKYNATDGKTILDPEDDAAHVNWGGKWRMPTEEEFTELREHCTWIWVEKNGINGYEITGSNGNSIFVPAAGFYYENGFNYGENGDYWSAEAGLPNNGIHLNFYPDKQIKSTSYRYFGFSIRPVYDDSN